MRVRPTDNQTKRSLLRSRWAAIGAAVAVSLGGSGLFVANAASSPASSVVTIDPVRILDTRADVGLPGPFVSAVSQKLQVTGTAVPAGATGVLLNVTVVNPSADGFLSVRPGDATGAPSTSSLNFKAGDIVPNSVQVGLPTSGTNAGKIDITYDAFGAAGPTTEVLIDAVGYMIAGTGTTGPAGPAGATGPAGPAGPAGLPFPEIVAGSATFPKVSIGGIPPSFQLPSGTLTQFAVPPCPGGGLQTSLFTAPNVRIVEFSGGGTTGYQGIAKWVGGLETSPVPVFIATISASCTLAPPP